MFLKKERRKDVSKKERIKDVSKKKKGERMSTTNQTHRSAINVTHVCRHVCADVPQVGVHATAIQ